MDEFKLIHTRASDRKGGDAALQQLLPTTLAPETLAQLPDSYFLAEMTRSIFRSGFVWRVINNKWPDFETAFHQFDLGLLMGLSEEQWTDYLQDSRIVRHRAKIMAVRSNVWFMHDTLIEYGSFGAFLAEWPTSELVELFIHLKKKGARLGGNTGQYFLQNVGKDSFALTKDVVMALKLAGLDIHDNPSSQKDLRKIQSTFNQWHLETSLPYRQLSMILAYSVGENHIQLENQ